MREALSVLPRLGLEPRQQAAGRGKRGRGATGRRRKRAGGGEEKRGGTEEWESVGGGKGGEGEGDKKHPLRGK